MSRNKRKHIGAGRQRVQWVWKRQASKRLASCSDRIVWTVSK